MFLAPPSGCWIRCCSGSLACMFYPLCAMDFWDSPLGGQHCSWAIFIHVFVHMNKHCWDLNLGSSVQCVADALPNEPCQVCIAIFAVSFINWSYDGSKCKLKCQLVQEDYISMWQTSLVLLIFNGTARTQLAILAFMYCEEFVKNSVAASYYLNASVTFWHRKWDANIILCWYVLLCMFEIWSVMYA